jgi:Dolichyl-phosphate-mannose-protein mannosyltransferase
MPFEDHPKAEAVQRLCLRGLLFPAELSNGGNRKSASFLSCPFSGGAGFLVSAAPWGLKGFQSPPRALYWTAAVVAVSLVLWIVLRTSRWKTAAGWILLALAGQACSLQLIWAGPQVRLQSLYGWGSLLGSAQGIFFLALLIQAGFVLWGARKLWPAIRSHLSRLITWPQVLILLLLEAFAASTFHPEVARSLVYGGFLRVALLESTKVVLGLAILGVGALNLVLAVGAIPSDFWEGIVSRWRASDRRRLVWWCALWVVVVSSLLAWLALDRMPHVPDELGYIFEAKYFSLGRLFLPLPPDGKSLYSAFQMVDSHKWYGAAPAGWPFVLAVGYRLGIPWLINPLLGGIAILLAHVFVRRLYNRDVADAAVLLLAASPWLLFLSASLMPHALSLALTLLGFVGVERAREKGSLSWAAVAGLSFGALLHVRALDAVLAAGVAGVWWVGVGWRRLRLSALVTACLAGVLMTALYLGYNKMFTGSPFLVPINDYMDKIYYKGSNRLGFGRDVGNVGWTGLTALPGYGPINLMMNSNQNLYLVNLEMYGWPCGSLVFVLLLFVRGKLRRDGLMWSLVITIWAGMSLYWFGGGPDYGARYWYQMILPLSVLTVLGVQAIIQRLIGIGATDSGRVWAFVALASLLGLANLIPWRSVDKYHDYRGIRPDIRKLETKYHFGRALIFVRGPEWPDYASAFPFNPPSFGPDARGPFFARDINAETNKQLIEYYGNRPVWILAGPTETGAGFKVIAGPLSPAQAEAGEFSHH